MKSKLPFIIIPVLIIAVLTAAILDIGPSPAIAKVNGETISAKEFQDRYKFDLQVYMAGQDTSGIDLQQAGEVTLASLIGEAATRQKAAELGFTVSDVEYQAALLDYPSLDEIVRVTAEGTGLPQNRVRDIWKEQIKGRVLLAELAEHYGIPADELIDQLYEEADVEVDDEWTAYIPAMN